MLRSSICYQGLGISITGQRYRFSSKITCFVLISCRSASPSVVEKFYSWGAEICRGKISELRNIFGLANSKNISKGGIVVQVLMLIFFFIIVALLQKIRFMEKCNHSTSQNARTILEKV